MRPYYIPYATIRDGEPFVSFHVGHPEDYIEEPPKVEDPEPLKVEVEEPLKVEEPELDEFDFYGIGKDNEPVDSPEEDEIMRRRMEARAKFAEMEKTAADFFEEDDFEQHNQDIQEFFKQPLPAAEFGDNIQELQVHPVFSNMSNDDKHELEIMATKEVVQSMELPEDHPDYDKVLCKRIESWIADWVSKKKTEVCKRLDKQKKARMPEEIIL